MSKLIIDKSTLDGIGDAIREQLGESDLIPVPELADKILEIEGGGGSTPIEIVYVEPISSVNAIEIPTDILLDEILMVFVKKTNYKTPASSTVHYTYGTFFPDGIRVQSNLYDYFLGVSTNWEGLNSNVRRSNTKNMEQGDGFILLNPNVSATQYFAPSEYEVVIIKKEVE